VLVGVADVVMSFGFSVILVAFSVLYQAAKVVPLSIAEALVGVADVVMSFGFSVILVAFSVLFQAAKVV